MTKPSHHPIKVSHFDADAIQRQKGANRRAIAEASPAQREAMQRTHSLVGHNRADLTLDNSALSDGFL